VRSSQRSSRVAGRRPSSNPRQSANPAAWTALPTPSPSRACRDRDGRVYGRRSRPADGRDEIGIADALRDISLRPGVNRRNDVILLLRRREHEHNRSGVLCLQVPSGVDAVHARHADVDNSHIGPRLPLLLQSRAVAGRLRRDHDAPRRTERLGQPLTKEGKVVHDHEPYVGHRGHR